MIDEQQTKQRKNTFWRELPILVVVAFVVALLVRVFVLQTFYIPSESMQHTLDINDRVLVNKVVYDFRGPHRGEIVVFKSPASWRSDPAEIDFIKRVIATGGDHVVCCDDQHRILVNGHSLNEPYLFHDVDGTADQPSDEPFDVTVPKDRLWVMGDHRSHSGDSREQYLRSRDPQAATIPAKSVIGRAFVVFWPLSRWTWLTVPSTFDGVPGPPKA
ncbi:MAG: signal peptidase [Micromonosporaceae bacterium]|nr:signal peptidase [Micromonosporaceae bacterium]